MIKKVADSDKNIIIKFLSRDEAFNAPILSQIERYGLSKGFQEVWTVHSGDFMTQAVIMRHFNHMYLYSLHGDADYEEIASFSLFLGPEFIWSGLNDLQNLKAFLPNYRIEPSKHMILHNPDSLINSDLTEYALTGDSAELAGMIFSDEDFKRFYASESEIEMGIRRRLEMGQCRYIIIRKGGEIASQAYSTIETCNFATIGGVITKPNHRGEGLAGIVVSAMCQQIFNNGKKPNLFYKTAEAGRLYKGLGFLGSGDYGMMSKS